MSVPHSTTPGALQTRVVPDYQYREALQVGSSLPIDEQASLRELSPSAVLAWADARVEDYQRHIKVLILHIHTLRSIHNSQLPIHILPSEVVGRILALTTGRDLHVTRVCRYWRAISTQDPHFWANVLDAKKLRLPQVHGKFLKAIVAKTASLPLHLTISYDFMAWWKIVSPQASSRTASLTVSLDAEAQVAALATALSSGGLHSLHALRASYTRMFDSPPGLPLNTENLPRLRELHIDAILLTTEFTLSSLESVTISGPLRTFQCLSRALKTTSSALQTLKLQHLSLMPTRAMRRDRDDSELQGLHFPQLRTFTSEGLVFGMPYCLHLPTSTSLSIIQGSSERGPLDIYIPTEYLTERYHGTGPLPDRLYLKPTSLPGQAEARCYAGARDLLHIIAHASLKSRPVGFLRPLSYALNNDSLSCLTVDIPFSTYAPDISWAIELFDVYRTCRLEILSPPPSAFNLATLSFRNSLTHRFLETNGGRGPKDDDSDLPLTLAWVVHLNPRDGAAGVFSQLSDLVSVLKRNSRKPRLELYAAKPTNASFRSLAGLHTDPDALRNVAAPILQWVEKLVDHLTVH
ncbi:hypothetical protein C8Q80DRAFT_1209848 [Daedaleopsis nitida]|nr:hypothetical protein C8Q80DRAFT_1209848 [Daedaleopsis nitida]